MKEANKQVVVSTRATRSERAMLRMLADQQGVTVADVVHEILFPEVLSRVRRAVEMDDRAGCAV